MKGLRVLSPTIVVCNGFSCKGLMYNPGYVCLSLTRRIHEDGWFLLFVFALPIESSKNRFIPLRSKHSEGRFIDLPSDLPDDGLLDAESHGIVFVKDLPVEEDYVTDLIEIGIVNSE